MRVVTPVERALFVAVLAGCWMGCNNPAQPKVDAGPRGEISISVTSPASKSDRPQLQRARVFVDVSAGIRGFDRLDRLLDKVETVAEEAGEGGKPEWCKPRTTCVTARQPDAGLPGCLAYRIEAPITWDCGDRPRPLLFYPFLTTSGLERVIAPRSKRPPPDSMDDAGLNVIILGGLTGEANPSSSGTAEAACGPDLSPNCLAKALIERLAQQPSYGVGLLVIEMSYRGTFFSPVAYDASRLQELRDHVKSLNVASDGEKKLFDGVKFDPPPSTTSVRGGGSLVTYAGAKPLLILVLSRDNFSSGRSFLERLKRHLSGDASFALGKMSPENTVRVEELAPLVPMAYTLKAPHLVEESVVEPTVRPNRIAMQELFPKQFKATAKEGQAEASVRCASGGRGYVKIPFDVTGGAALPVFLEQTPSLVPVGASAPVPSLKGSSFYVLVSCKGPHPVNVVHEYKLRARLSVKPDRVGDAWWAKMSAERAYDMPERTHGLRDVVRAVLDRSTSMEHDVGSFKLRIDRYP